MPSGRIRDRISTKERIIGLIVIFVGLLAIIYSAMNYGVTSIFFIIGAAIGLLILLFGFGMAFRRAMLFR
jgi:uncharacterized membrane protein